MSHPKLTRLARGALAVTALVAAAIGSGTTTAVIDWVAAHDKVDVPYVRDCKGILRHPEECPPPLGTKAHLRAALGTGSDTGSSAGPPTGVPQFHPPELRSARIRNR